MKRIPLFNRLIITLFLVFVGLYASIPPPATAQVTCTNENQAVPASTPTSNFVDHGDGTVSDKTTGLMWMRCSRNQTWNGSTCAGTANTLTWVNALAYVATFNAGGYAGHNDWRLPSKNELASIIEFRCYSPTINAAVFPNTVATHQFWTSSPYTASALNAWYVRFDTGVVGPAAKTGGRRVRLVRGGQ